MKRKANISNLIARLAADESQFLRVSFLAPVKKAASVGVRIGGVVCRVRVRPHGFEGWGVFQPTSYTEARLEREASLAERSAYLRLFPARRFVLIRKVDGGWLGQPAQAGDWRGPSELTTIEGVDDADRFDTVLARDDGARLWFDQVDPAADPSIAAYLRESIVKMLDPRRLTRPGLTPEQRIAYAALYAQITQEHVAGERASAEHRLRQAVEHAGATLRDFAERDGIYRVSFMLDGARHMSAIRRDDLRVESAGVCLSGQDRAFDLASLVSVLREGQKRGRIYHGLQV